MEHLLDELGWRGLIHDVTPQLADRLAAGPIVGYCGFDATARSLQIGNLVPVMLLAHLQRAGGTPIALVGAGTGMIGDPSGRSSERPLLSATEIDENAERIRAQLERFLDFSGGNAARMLNNADWLRPLALLDFLRDIGKHFTIANMLQKESVKSRLDGGISFTEFSYMLLQAYDFLHLNRTANCELQVGGSDQWGNITAGAELIRRVDGGSGHALSAPLITMASGAKFGKSEGGAVWLDPELTSPYKFFQFWINADDADVETYLKVFTFLTEDVIRDLVQRHRDDPGARAAQRALADDLTTRIHGVETARRAAETSRVFFDRTNVETIRTAPIEVWETLERELPSWHTSSGKLPETVVELAAASGLTASKGEARRQLQQGGVSVNGERMGVDATVSTDQLLAGRYIWLRRGKKTDVIVRVDAKA